MGKKRRCLVVHFFDIVLIVEIRRESKAEINKEGKRKNNKASLEGHIAHGAHTRERNWQNFELNKSVIYARRPTQTPLFRHGRRCFFYLISINFIIIHS